jgi:hypothetical protein
MPYAVFESPAEKVCLLSRASGDPVLKPFHFPIDASWQLRHKRTLHPRAFGKAPSDVTELCWIVLVDE